MDDIHSVAAIIYNNPERVVECVNRSEQRYNSSLLSKAPPRFRDDSPNSNQMVH